ncbi:MAG TPA: tetratricopeptide repeat protein [Candidatus Didemnitutus sp.]|nr:tetratricopeptide repeat protein [Candidatus Didemnitutus sp.]
MNQPRPFRLNSLVSFALVLGLVGALRSEEPAAAPIENITAFAAEAPKPEKPAVVPEESAADEKAAEARGLLSLGANLAERNDYAASEIAYRQVLNSGEFAVADQKDALLGLAKMFRREGTFTKASAIYEKYLKEFPDDPRAPDAMLELGRTLRSMGAYKLAISRFYSVINSTLKLPTESFDHYQQLAKTAQFEIAETYFTAGNFAEAGKFFSRLRLLDLAPQDRARAHFKSAYSLQLGGDLEGAVRTLRDYLDQWPDDENIPEARYLLATSLRQLNRPDEALAATLDLLRSEQPKSGVDPKRWAYWQRRTGNQLANEFFQSGDTINALAIYQGLSALAPDPTWRLPITYQIALCYERLRLVERARTAYQSIIDGAAAAAEGKAGSGQPGTGTDIAELARMATWRLSQLDWSDQTDHQLTVFFSTATGQPILPPSAPDHDSNGSTAAAPAALR